MKKYKFMNLNKLKIIFSERNVDSSSYSINQTCSENTYCANNSSGKWEVFYFKNREKNMLKIFASESEAGTYLYDLVFKDPSTRVKRNIKDIDALKERLNDLGVRESDYVLGFFWDDKFSIIKNEQNKWEVFFSERGNKNDLQVFDTEYEACEYFFNYITGFDFIMNDLKPKEEPKKKGLLGRLGFKCTNTE
ncbi:hypothetical protein VOI54_10665 [Tamlana sp. 2201CG12-4]|uniref:hypothetical protein n=1 Tax=Tamlana sp. 2201CG12-4 TaxID=3112582 RepID=UPI002DB6C018|nr:hypothetical protein [Tamlana sp. 2201CG12-4]MEC3907482.1 hypothetical protein [Tamlana sp. 2201CG12-4]